MNVMGRGYLFYAFLIIIAILFVISVIKKIFKLVIFLIAIIIIYSAYNVFVNGTSPLSEVKGYGVDIKYGRQIGEYSTKIKDSIDKVKNVIETKNFDKENLQVIKLENEKLHTYKSEIEKLHHTNNVNEFHKKYCGYVKDIVYVSDSIEKTGQLTGNKNLVQAEEMLKKLNRNISDLMNLK